MAADSGKRYRSAVFSTLLAASVVVLFLIYRSDVVDAFADIRISWIALGLFCFMLNYVFRASRIHRLTSRRVRIFPDGIYCCGLHGFATYMLPLRAGELSLPFILKSIALIELRAGAQILYRARLLDVLVLGFWMIVASLLPVSTLPVGYKLVMGSLGVLMIMTPIVLGKVSSRFLVRFERLNTLAKSVAECNRFNAMEISLSIGVWMASAAMLWCITAALHLSLSIDELFLLVAIQLVMQLFPLQGFANSGNHESGWMAAMIAIGYPVEVALKFALASHAVILVFVLFLGLVALALRQVMIR